MIKKIKFTGAKQGVLAVVIAVCVLVYTVYHVTGLFGEDITTIATGVSTETQLIDAKGYVFRDEAVLYSSNTGVADYFKADGSKVSVGESLASVRAGGGNNEKKLLSYYDEKIEILEQSVHSGVTLAQLPQVSSEISDTYYSLCTMLASGNTSELRAASDKLMLEMNKYSILTDGEDCVVDDTLAAMTEKRDALLNNGTSAVTEKAADSGYFYSYVDGFEGQFTIEAAQTLTPDSFDRLTMRTKPDERATTYAYGKLSASSEWQFAVRMAGVTSGYFEVGETYSLRFIENGNAVIPMTLTQSINDAAHGGRILVFSADRLPDGFVFDRCQSVSIQLSSVSGIYVPRSAVYRLKEGLCVYVLKGSVVKLRQIEIVYEGSDYVLCAVQPEHKGSIEYLGTNELLILNGKNLFDGRILD